MKKLCGMLFVLVIIFSGVMSFSVYANVTYWSEDFSNTTGDIRLSGTANYLLKDAYENPVFTNVARNSGDLMAYDKWRLCVRTAAETDAGSLYFFRTADASANDSNVTFEKRFSEVISGGFNIEYSVKPQSGSYRFIIGVDKTISSSSWGPSILDIGNTSFASDEIRVSNQSIKYTNGKWHHFVLSFNGAGKCDIYMDGVPMFKNVSSSNTLGRLKFTAITYANTAAECYFDNFKIYQASDFGGVVASNDCTLTSNSASNIVDSAYTSVTANCDTATYTVADLRSSLSSNGTVSFYNSDNEEIIDEESSVSNVSRIVVSAANGISIRSYNFIVKAISISSAVYTTDILANTISGVINYTAYTDFINNLNLADGVSIVSITDNGTPVASTGCVANGMVLNILNNGVAESYTIKTEYEINNNFTEYAGKMIYSDNKSDSSNYPAGINSVSLDHAWMSATSNTNGLSVITGVQKDGNDVLQFRSDLTNVTELGGSYTGKRYIGKTFSEPLTGKVYIACSVYLDDMNAKRQLVFRNVNANGFMIPASFDTDGILTVCDKKYPYQIGKWYNIEVCMDLDNDIQTIYINNIRVNMRSEIAGFKSMSLVRFEDFVVPGKVTNAYIDDLVVYKTASFPPIDEVAQYTTVGITLYKNSVSEANIISLMTDISSGDKVIAYCPSLTNNSFENITAALCIAAYNDKRLVTMSMSTIANLEAESSDDMQAEIPAQALTGVTDVRAFVWRWDNLMPISPVENLE